MTDAKIHIYEQGKDDLKMGQSICTNGGVTPKFNLPKGTEGISEFLNKVNEACQKSTQEWNDPFPNISSLRAVINNSEYDEFNITIGRAEGICVSGDSVKGKSSKVRKKDEKEVTVFSVGSEMAHKANEVCKKSAEKKGGPSI